MRTRLPNKELVFTTNIEKVPSLQQRYATKYASVKEHSPLSKVEKAQLKLQQCFTPQNKNKSV